MNKPELATVLFKLTHLLQDIYDNRVTIINLVLELGAVCLK